MPISTVTSDGVERRPGRILTFYSYKGGTGRSMAVANIAWILSSSGKKVPVLDWDLEAPGLHRYFRPFLIDKEMTSSEGVIDFVSNYSAEALKPKGREICPKTGTRSTPTSSSTPSP